MKQRVSNIKKVKISAKPTEDAEDLVDDREETHDAHATSSSSMNLITMNMV
jgi:hypothetical protein